MVRIVQTAVLVAQVGILQAENARLRRRLEAIAHLAAAPLPPDDVPVPSYQYQDVVNGGGVEVRVLP